MNTSFLPNNEAFIFVQKLKSYDPGKVLSYIMVGYVNQTDASSFTVMTIACTQRQDNSTTFKNSWSCDYTF